jgi:hypothetical protein
MAEAKAAAAPKAKKQGANLRKRLIDCGIPQYELAGRIGLAPSTLGKCMAGQAPWRLDAICSAMRELKIPMEDFCKYWGEYMA